MTHIEVNKFARSFKNKFTRSLKTCQNGSLDHEETKKLGKTNLDHLLDLSELKWVQETPGVSFLNFLRVFLFILFEENLA